VLLKVYAKCIDGQDQIAKRAAARDALRESDDGPATGTRRGPLRTAAMTPG
jgi:hypothetical protein